MSLPAMIGVGAPVLVMVRLDCVCTVVPAERMSVPAGLTEDTVTWLDSAVLHVTSAHTLTVIIKLADSAAATTSLLKTTVPLVPTAGAEERFQPLGNGVAEMNTVPAGSGSDTVTVLVTTPPLRILI